MQTFLPYDDYLKCAMVLDRQRLGKQRVEVLQILNCIRNNTKGWKHHPAVEMWRGYTNELILYGCCICDEWVRRGYKDTCRAKIVAHFDDGEGFSIPKWMGRQPLHFSHKCNLYRKNPEHYYRYFGLLPIDVPYYWPSSSEEKTTW